MNTCPHSVHSFKAVSNLLIVEGSKSVRVAAEKWEAHINFQVVAKRNEYVFRTTSL